MTSSLCVLDTSVASDVQAAGLWTAIAGLESVFVIPQLVAVTEFRAADLAEARARGILIEPLTGDEDAAAAALATIHRKPSPNDLAALALAESRGATLLTGDGHLRAAALVESVEVHGVLWLLDTLLDACCLQPAAAASALDAILADGSRLPEAECARRLSAWRA
jgi:hypothetical protein